MRIFNCLLVAILLVINLSGLMAQQVKTVFPGSAKGVIRDTARNYVLKSATVSVYKVAESSLLNYQVSNNYGEFNFQNLPTGVLLRVEISYVGYKACTKNFTIPVDKNSIDLQTLIITPLDKTLEDVVVSVPPIRMNGDTLEFNAAAFKLDSNAVVEDLLRKIPNITLWGDGQITVNGREVKSVLVNGKPFFGGDAIVATQNIAKNALEKIQVYNVAQNRDNPQDSSLEMNLKLKKGKEIDYFGKVSVGFGTNNRFEADANINMFTPKMQLGIIGATNNINKSANNIRTLVANSTFKGTGTKVEYQPDFRATGINKPAAAGVTFTYNFIEKPTYDNKKSLTANYFLQDRNNDVLSESETTTTLNNTEKIYEKNSSSSSSQSTYQTVDSRYEWMKKNKSLNISQSLNLNNGENNSETKRSAENNQRELTSTNNSKNQSKFDNKGFNIVANYGLSQDWTKPKQFIKDLRIDYSLRTNDNNSDRLNITNFRSFTNPTANRDFNRKFHTNTKSTNQQLDAAWGNLRSTLFGDKVRLGGIDFAITNKLLYNTSKAHNSVEDLNIGNSKYQLNPYLTNRVEVTTLDETAGMRFSKSFNRHLSNRYSKNLMFGFSPQYKLIYQNNKSDRAFQNLKRNYRQFMPDASVSYNDYRYGAFARNYSINFTNTIRIPTLDELAPLIDSTNLYSINRGNTGLSASLERALSLNISHYDQKGKNTLNYNATLSGGIIDNDIADSIFIDSDNKRITYRVNADGNRFVNFYGNIRKAHKLKTAEIQVGVNGSANFTKAPGYLNSAFTFSSNLNTRTALTLNYTYKDKLALEAEQAYQTYKSKQESFNTEYSGTNTSTSLSGSYNITKKITLNSNIRYNLSTTSTAASIYYTIWNASVIYRFLKGNNAEIKIAALDLLHQNTSVTNFGSANSFTIGTQNVLQQYFMATLSFYPRQFGKKPAGK